MKKLVFFLGIIILSFYMHDRAYAESLNEYELAIIEAAGEIYEHEGISYKVDQKYISQLVDYLSLDSIDITEGDKELIIQLAYANIETGIKDGYLKPIEELKNQGERIDTNNKDNIEDTIKEVLESVGKDISDIKSYIPSVISDTDNSDKSLETSYNTDSEVILSLVSSDQTTNEGSNMNDTHTEAIDDGKQDYNSISSYDINDNSMEDGIIKQTGYNLNSTLYIIIGMGILMIIGIYITVKNDYFAHAYE